MKAVQCYLGKLRTLPMTRVERSEQREFRRVDARWHSVSQHDVR
jgi:hypothetical protein